MLRLSRLFRLMMILVLIITSAAEAIPRAQAKTVSMEPEQQIPAALQAERIVYDDSLAPGWEDWSWDSIVAFDNASPTLTGPASIAVTFHTAWAGFSVRTAPPLPASEISAISFFVYAPDTDRALALMVQAADDGGESQRYDFNAPANEWSQIVIGLDSLGNPPAVARINIADNSGAPQATFYLDQISLLTTGTGAGSDIPAVLPGAPKASISLSADHGYSGQEVVVSGVAPSGYSGVRLAWLFDGATFTAAEVAVEGAGAYSASLEVPAGAPEGPAQLCASVAGSAQAVFTCADYRVDPPEPVQVTGEVDPELVAAGETAEVQLLNAAGDMLYTAPLQASGKFSFPAVRPGLYVYGLVGGLRKPAATGLFEASVSPISNPNHIVVSKALPNASTDPILNRTCYPEDNLASVGTLGAQYSSRGANIASASGTGVQTPEGSAAFNFAYPLKKAQQRAVFGRRSDYGAYFGTYLSGVALQNEFRANLQMHNTGGQQVSVQYHLILPDDSELDLGRAAEPPYAVRVDMGRLPRGTSLLVAAPVVGGQRQCPLTREIRVAANPMANPMYQAGAYARWNNSQGAYEFGGTLPNAGGLLPLAYPSNPTHLPFLGNIQSRLSAGLTITGLIHLNGIVQIQAASAYALAVLFGQTIFDEPRPVSPPQGPGIYLGKRGYEDLAVQTGPHKLWNHHFEQTVFTGPIFSFLGMITVGASVRVGIGGELVLNATLFPLQPNAEIRLEPTVGVNLALSLWVNILVVASGGADAIPTVKLKLPLNISTRDDRLVWFDDPCYGIRVDLKMWVEVDYWLDSWRKERVTNLFHEDEPDGCLFAAAQAAAVEAAAALMKQAEVNATLAPLNPRVMASPIVAASSKGHVLSVYIEDLTPEAELPSAAVMARFKDPQTDDWLTAVQLSDGKHAVNDPAAAFFETPQGVGAMVAWSQTEMTQAEEQAADSLDDYLNHLEIYYSYWDGQIWSSPARLTNDLQGDGFPALAGENFFGLATLAWVRDGDGDSTTLSDVDVVASIWDSQMASWSAPAIISLEAAGLDFEVSVDRREGYTALAWTHDADGSHETLDDRYLSMTLRGGELPGWYRFTPQPLLARAGQPSVIIEQCCTGLRLRLAFVMHMLDGDGKTAAAVGDNMAIWTATVDFPDGKPTITAQPLLDEAGRVVRGERPRLHTGKGGEILLTFRRFGELGSAGQLGQVAVSQYIPGQEGSNFSPPVYLTGGLAQHWQPAAALNSLNNKLELLAVQRQVINPAVLQAIGGPESTAASLPALSLAPDGSALSQETLSAAYSHLAQLHSLAAVPLAAAESPDALTQSTDDPLISLSYAPEGDPALDPVLQLSKAHAAVGSSVTVTATVRNLGRTALPLTVRFFRGQPGSGSQVSEQTLGELAGGAVATVSTELTVQGGDEPVYAEVSAGSGAPDANPANNIAGGNLGALPAPQIASVQPSQVFDNALEITILPGEAEDVSGYRTLRSEATGGPYELVGETTGEIHYDLSLTLGRVYCYVVQAYDRSGMTSPYSGEVCDLVPSNQLFLPIVSR